MNKKDYAEAQAHTMMAAQLLDNALDKLADSIGEQINILINLDPRIALSLIEQLGEHKEMLEEAVKARDSKLEDLSGTIAKNIPDVIEFDED